MIKRKLKVCSDCGKEKYLFSNGRCEQCYKIWKNYTISKVSKKTKERHKTYNELRLDYLALHPICEVGVKGCTKKSTEIHHKRGRIGENLYRDFCAICRNCHNYVESHPEESYQKGWMLKRN